MGAIGNTTALAVLLRRLGNIENIINIIVVVINIMIITIIMVITIIMMIREMRSVFNCLLAALSTADLLFCLANLAITPVALGR